MILFGIFTVSTCLAEVFAPVHIFLPGNFAGKAVFLSEALEPMPAPCWKAPSLLDSFRKFSRDSINLTYAVGNDSSILELPSFVCNGDQDRKLLEKCRFNAAAAGPADMMIFRNSLLSNEIRQRIITNLEPENDYNIFPPYFAERINDFRVWYFNFLGREEFASLPLEKWGQIKPEDPSRTLRRMQPGICGKDISISTVHMNKVQTLELTNELKNFPGTHLVIQVVTSAEDADFSTFEPQRIDNCFVFSIYEGQRKLPLIKLYRRNFGYPRLKLHMLPYDKAETGTAVRDFVELRKNIVNDLFKTLTLVPTSIRPSTAPFRFNPKLYAKFCQNYMSADVAVILPPDEKHKAENVISVASALGCFNNEKIFRTRMTGIELKKFVAKMLSSSSSPAPVFSGITCKYIANQVTDIEINHFPFRPTFNYSVALNERIIEDRIFAKTLESSVIEPFDGTTLWDVWQNQLKSLRMKSEHLLD